MYFFIYLFRHSLLRFHYYCTINKIYSISILFNLHDFIEYLFDICLKEENI